MALQGGGEGYGGDHAFGGIGLGVGPIGALADRRRTHRHQSRDVQAAAQDFVHRDPIRRHVTDAFGVRAVAVGRDRQGFAVDRAARAHVADKAAAGNGRRVGARGAEVIGLHPVEVDRHCDRQRIRQVRNIAAPGARQQDLAHGAAVGGSSTVPQARHVRRARSV